MSYREAALICPACADTMDPHGSGGAVIDVCPGCGGLWVDWFDGDLVDMVRGAPPAEGAPPRQAGGSACPRCNLPLAAERFLDSGAEILRCGDCSGAFVPRDAARAITEAPHGPAPAGDALSRLAATLQRWFGWEEGG